MLIGMLMLALIMGFSAIPNIALSQPEVLYLTDTGNAGDQGGTGLYRVDLDDGTNTATLTQLEILPYSPTGNSFDAAHIACSPDGTKIYCIDNPTGSLGVYDVLTDTFTPGTAKVKAGATTLTGLTLAAIGPNGYIYTATDTEKLSFLSG